MSQTTPIPVTPIHHIPSHLQLRNKNVVGTSVQTFNANLVADVLNNCSLTRIPVDNHCYAKPDTLTLSGINFLIRIHDVPVCWIEFSIDDDVLVVSNLRYAVCSRISYVSTLLNYTCSSLFCVNDSLRYLRCNSYGIKIFNYGMVKFPRRVSYRYSKWFVSQNIIIPDNLNMRCFRQFGGRVGNIKCELFRYEYS